MSRSEVKVAEAPRNDLPSDKFRCGQLWQGGGLGSGSRCKGYPVIRQTSWSPDTACDLLARDCKKLSQTDVDTPPEPALKRAASS